MDQDKKRTYDNNSQVVYVDEHGEKHAALPTIWWHGQAAISTYVAPNGEPGVNLIYVNKDVEQRDNCGQKHVNATSVMHKTHPHVAGRRYWCWPDEVDA